MAEYTVISDESSTGGSNGEGSASSQESVCPSCNERPATEEVFGRSYCRRCAEILLYKMSKPAWNALLEVEQSEGGDSHGFSSETAKAEEPFYVPPYPGGQSYSRFIRLRENNSGGYRVNLTRPLRVSPIEQGNHVQVYADKSPAGLPVLDLFYIDEDEEDVDKLPQARKIGGSDGPNVNIPTGAVRHLFHDYIEVPESEYDPEENPVLLWPQVTPDRVRLYAIAFEDEWEQLPEENPASDSGTSSGAESGNPAESDVGRPTTSDVEQRREAARHALGQLPISESTVDLIASSNGLNFPELVDALQIVDQQIDREWIAAQAVEGPVQLEESDVYVVPTAVWEDDSKFASLGDLSHLKDAVRYAHNLDAKEAGEEAEADYIAALTLREAFILSA